MIKRIFPFLDWFSGYNLNLFKADSIAGLTVALVLIPQSMAYAQLAGMPPYYGLYASFLPPLVAALFGSSRQLATGPDTILSCGAYLLSDDRSDKSPARQPRWRLHASQCWGKNGEPTGAVIALFRASHPPAQPRRFSWKLEKLRSKGFICRQTGPSKKTSPHSPRLTLPNLALLSRRE